MGKIYLLIFIVLAVMLRFNSSLLEVFDAIFAIAAQEVAKSLYFLAGPADFFSSLWVAWLATILWAFFIRYLGFKVGSWWVVVIATAFFLLMLLTSVLVFFSWSNGPSFNQTMPDLTLGMWGLLFCEIQNIIVKKIRSAGWLKFLIGKTMVLLWIMVAGNKIVNYDLSFTTAVGSILLSYVFARFAMKLYLKNAKAWLSIFAVDGKI
ncbi:hypothetical protein [Fructobacillus ficulneus]|uniref:hypothetical protein n=1 Tax=Fructobacillus ficulneus TaxID=157463 RepID=UPI000785F67C|nr:hypothetical protein [Fructobacillus ficulneus]